MSRSTAFAERPTADQPRPRGQDRVSPSTSLERVKLRERGVITGYHAAVDLEAMGRPVQALIPVRIRPPARPVIEQFREWAGPPGCPR
jgi:DNA-binding Lrp family transcriptional regulator